MRPVESNDLQTALKYIEDGGRLIIPTYTRITIIDKKCLDKWTKAGYQLLKEEGKGYRLRQGRGSVYLISGQLKYEV